MSGKISSSSSKRGGARANSGGRRANAGGRRANAGGARANAGGARANSGGRRAGAGRPRNPPIVLREIVDRRQWFCIRTKARRQHELDVELRLNGFEVFNPSIFVPARPMRRDAGGHVSPAVPAHTEPMFPGFIMVALNLADPLWMGIRMLPGFHSFMGTDASGTPAAIPASEIHAIEKLLDTNGCMYPPGYTGYQHPPLATVGKPQRLLTGVLEGAEGMCEWEDGKRIGLVMRMFGRDVPVTVTHDAVAEIECIAA